ncbi:MAG: hypothetical protein QGI75_00320 [Phycisphaerales bacterium]|nr:hypothetical protein [Phycisphaerales bacterium]
MKYLLSRGLGVAAAMTLAAVVAAAPFGKAAVPTEISRMVPAGCYLLGYTDSLQDLQQAMLGSVSAVEPQMAPMVAMGGPATLLNMMVMKEGGGMGSGGVKVDGAAAMFMGPADPETGEPLTGVIFEVADAEGLVSTQPTSTLVRLPETNWVCLASRGYTLPSTPSSLGGGMLDSTISANIDQATVVKEFKTEIDNMLAMMQRPLPEGALSADQWAIMQRSQAANAAKLKMFMDMISKWDIGIDLNGADLDVLMRMVPTDQSMITKGTPGLQAVARFVPGDMPITGVANGDVISMMMEMSKADFEVMPPDVRAKMEALMPIWTSCLDSMKTGVGFGMSFGEKGIEVVTVMDTDEPDAALAAIEKGWAALLKADIGVDAKPLQIMRGKGAGYLVTLDAKQLMAMVGMDSMIPPPAEGQPDPMAMVQGMLDDFMGADGMPVRYLVEGNHIVSVVGNGRLVSARALVASGGADNSLSDLLTDPLAAPTWAVSVDVRQAIDGGLGFARALMGPMGAMLPPAAPAGEPVLLTMVGSTEGTTWDQIRIQTNMKAWYAMIQEFKQAFQPPAKPIAEATPASSM